MRLWGLNNKQEQIMLYLYEFKHTPERGVGPDPRLTVRGITEGTQIPSHDIRKQLEKLVTKALVRPVFVGYNTFYYLTIKGYNHVEKVQQRSLRIGIDERGLSFGFKKSETKGTRTSRSEGERIEG